MQVSVVAGTLLYLLHTTLSEMLAARTLGKMALGLRVVALDGTRPTPGALLTRNLLRVIDLLRRSSRWSWCSTRRCASAPATWRPGRSSS